MLGWLQSFVPQLHQRYTATAVSHQRTQCSIHHGIQAGRVSITQVAVHPQRLGTPTPKSHVPPCRRHEGCGPVYKMSLKQYCAWWRQHKHAEHAVDQQTLEMATPSAMYHPRESHLAVPSSSSCGGYAGCGAQAGRNVGDDAHAECAAVLYLKDWHFARDFPEYKVCVGVEGVVIVGVEVWRGGCQLVQR